MVVLWFLFEDLCFGGWVRCRCLFWVVIASKFVASCAVLFCCVDCGLLYLDLLPCGVTRA